MPRSTSAAGVARGDGDPRGRGHLMADILVERVTGQACADAVPVEIQLVMPAETLLGEGEEPALVAGHGAVPAAFARDLAAPGAARRERRRGCADCSPRRMLSDLVAMESRRRRFDGPLRELHRAPRPDLPHAVVRRPDPPRRPCRPRTGPVATTSAKRAGALRGLQLRQGGTRLACHDAGPGAVAGRPHAPPHTVRTTTPTGHVYDSTAPPLLHTRRGDRPSTLERHILHQLAVACCLACAR